MGIVRLIEGAKTSGGEYFAELQCDFRVSERCVNTRMVVYPTYYLYKFGKPYKCRNCSKTEQFAVRANNPNLRFKTLDENLLETIDTVQKAYLLGWIASDGHVSKSSHTIGIGLRASDINILTDIRDLICKELPVKIRNYGEMVELLIHSKKMSSDICKHLKIVRGKKSHTVRFPDLLTEELNWAFLKGYVEGDGWVTCGLPPKQHKFAIEIASCSDKMLDDIIEKSKMPFSRKVVQFGEKVSLYSSNAKLFLDRMYSIEGLPTLERKYLKYVARCDYLVTPKPKKTKPIVLNKICMECDENFDIENFHFDDKLTGKRNPRCKDCRNKLNRQRYRTNK